MQTVHRTLCLLILSTLMLAPGVQAQGVVVGSDGRPAALALGLHRVQADVQEQVAVVTVEHVFKNTTQGTIEGSFLFPLPPEAQVSRFTMEVDGEELVGELLEADEARQIYEEIVRKSLDPALLEMADYRTFRASVFPIPPGEERRITLRYDATLPKEGQTVVFRYPMQGDLSARGAFFPTPRPRRPMAPGVGNQNEQSQPGQETETSGQTLIEVDLETAAGLRNIYSPSHEIDLRQRRDSRATVTFEAEGALDGRDFVLYYSLDDAEIGATALAHRPYSDRPGYFMLLVSPEVEVDASRVQQKDVVFVLDTSGSMAGEKMEQAKEALAYCLNRLGERDRFGLVAFSSDVDAFQDDLAETGSDVRDDALYFVDQLEARGGTNINEALLTALELLDGSERGMVVFLTDGLPSTGVTDEGAIRRNVDEANGADPASGAGQAVRVFSFGVGYDVNTRLLDGLSGQSGAFASYVSPEENLEERVSAFYEKVRYPVLTDLEFDLDGIDAYAYAPGTLPDLYKGGQLILTGRYRDPGEATLTLRGESEDGAETLTYTFDLPDEERDQDFVARLWATRRVGALLEEIRMNGENEELKDEVVALAKEFGLVTPYTSYLVQEEEMMAGRRLQEPRGRSFAPLGARAGGAVQMDQAEAAPAPEEALTQTSGRQAVQMSKSIRAMREASAAPAAGSERLTNIEGRTLRRTDEGRWVDVEFEEGDEVVEIQFASEAYFEILRRYPDVQAFARLGADILFGTGETFVRFGEEGKATLTQAEMEALFEG